MQTLSQPIETHLPQAQCSTCPPEIELIGYSRTQLVAATAGRMVDPSDYWRAREILQTNGCRAFLSPRLVASEAQKIAVFHLIDQMEHGIYRCFTPLRSGMTWERFIFHLRVREHFRDQVRHRLKRLADKTAIPLRNAFRPTDRDQEFGALPRSLDWLYSLVRSIRLTQELNLTLSQLLTGNSARSHPVLIQL